MTGRGTPNIQSKIPRPMATPYVVVWWMHGAAAFTVVVVPQRLKSCKDFLTIRPRRLVGAAGLIREFLAGQRCGVHQPTLGDREYGHPVVVDAVRGCIPLARAGAGCHAVGAGTGIGAGRDCDCARSCCKLEAAGLELFERALILKENDLREVFAASLKSHAELLQRGIAHEFSTHIDAAPAECAAQDESALADIREHGIAVAVLEECRALARILEQRESVLVLAGVGSADRAEQRQRKEQELFQPGHVLSSHGHSRS